ncbi:peptidoglycan-binding protein [Pseudooctadecabacter sp.]|uniref:peptidoglycan-binding domain-containing protein n=1 Tax=Pseudooctadecabacter sp. TaxID=1966338 RepID=UPI0035C79B97
MKGLASVAFWALGASALAAEPCVTATFDRPLDGATDVVSHVSDVPSVRFPAFWQEGVFDGVRYKITAASEGVVRPLNFVDDWEVSFVCDQATGTCDFDENRAPPEQAVAAAKVIGQCLLGLDLTPDPAPVEVTVEAAEPDITPPTEPDATVPTPTPEPAAAAPCGSAAVDEATEIATLQRLLLLAGQDPGPVDGFLGPKSFAAMGAFVDDPGWNTPISDVIAILDAQLCDAPQSAANE